MVGPYILIDIKRRIFETQRGREEGPMEMELGKKALWKWSYVATAKG